MIGLTAVIGTLAIIGMTLVSERLSRGAAKAATDIAPSGKCWRTQLSATPRCSARSA